MLLIRLLSFVSPNHVMACAGAKESVAERKENEYQEGTTAKCCLKKFPIVKRMISCCLPILATSEYN